MANPETGVHSTQTVGDFTASFFHPLAFDPGISAGVQTLKGFKLEDTFVTSGQLIENAKLIALVNGDTVTLTNIVKAGRLTINALRVGDSVASGDIVWIADLLKSSADSSNTGYIQFSFGFNGNTEIITFWNIHMVSCPPIILAGNDLPPYPVVWSYGTYTRG